MSHSSPWLQPIRSTWDIGGNRRVVQSRCVANCPKNWAILNGWEGMIKSNFGCVQPLAERSTPLFLHVEGEAELHGPVLLDETGTIERTVLFAVEAQLIIVPAHGQTKYPIQF